MNGEYPWAAAAHHRELGFLIAGHHPYPSINLGHLLQITTDGVTFDQFTPLPNEGAASCLVALDSDFGNFFACGTRGAFIHKTNQWTEVAEMPTPRSGKKFQF